MKIKDLRLGEQFNDLRVLIRSSSKRVSNGKTFLVLSLQDNTGTVSTTIWNPRPYDEDICQSGNYLRISGDVNQYLGALQLKVSRVEPYTLVHEEEYLDFILASSIELSTLTSKLKAYMDSIKNRDARAIVVYIVEKYYSPLVKHPAAKSMHHDYASGLLQHTIKMADLGMAIYETYKDLYAIDIDLLISGILIHDIGKVIELSPLPDTDYTLEGNLVGHISIGCYEIREAARELKIKSEVPILLQHLVLSHHGVHEYGSPVLPKTTEAVLLNLIDLTDSKLESIAKNMADVMPGEFSSRIAAFDGRSFYKPNNEKLSAPTDIDFEDDGE